MQPTQMKKLFNIIVAAALLAVSISNCPAASPVPGQVQLVIDNSTTVSNLNYVLAATTVGFNPPGIATTNNALYSTNNLPAPAFYAVGARQLALSGTMNLTATNTTAETFSLYCSLNGTDWLVPSKAGVANADAILVSSLNTDYSVTNLIFGTNIDTGGWPMWCIGKYQHSGASGVSTNVGIKAYTKTGGL
jgi:hypothetical protein